VQPDQIVSTYAWGMSSLKKHNLDKDVRDEKRQVIEERSDM